MLKIEHPVTCLTTMAYVYAACAVHVAIFITGGKFRLVSNFAELHTLTLSARSYGLLKKPNSVCTGANWQPLQSKGIFSSSCFTHGITSLVSVCALPSLSITSCFNTFPLQELYSIFALSLFLRSTSGFSGTKWCLLTSLRKMTQ